MITGRYQKGAFPQLIFTAMIDCPNYLVWVLIV